MPPRPRPPSEKSESAFDLQRSRFATHPPKSSRELFRRNSKPHSEDAWPSVESFPESPAPPPEIRFEKAPEPYCFETATQIVRPHLKTPRPHSAARAPFPLQ